MKFSLSWEVCVFLLNNFYLFLVRQIFCEGDSTAQITKAAFLTSAKNRWKTGHFFLLWHLFMSHAVYTKMIVNLSTRCWDDSNPIYQMMIWEQSYLPNNEMIVILSNRWFSYLPDNDVRVILQDLPDREKYSYLQANRVRIQWAVKVLQTVTRKIHFSNANIPAYSQDIQVLLMVLYFTFALVSWKQNYQLIFLITLCSAFT